jgi:hypothetical protein
MPSVKKRKKAEAEWLKSWFDLGRYPNAELKSFGLDTWGQQFEIRRKLVRCIDLPSRFDDSSSTRRWCLERLRDAPLSIGGVMPRIITRAPVMDMAHEEVRAQQWLYELPGIKDIVDSWEVKQGSSDVGTRVLNAVIAGGVRGEGVRGISAHRELLAALGHAQQDADSGDGSKDAVRFLQVGYAGVDFSFSNEVLIAHFTQWLEKKRAAFHAADIHELSHARDTSLGKRPRVIISDTSSEKWIAHRVLPYLDVRIMAAEDGLDMPPAQILADTLFEGFHAQGGNEKVKIYQQLKPLAERLIDSDVIERLILDGQAGRLGSKN